MKQRKAHVLRAIFVGLFAVSLSVAGAALVEPAWGAPAGTPACPKCNLTGLTCYGSTCNCNWVGPGSLDYTCQGSVN